MDPKGFLETLLFAFKCAFIPLSMGCIIDLLYLAAVVIRAASF